MSESGYVELPVIAWLSGHGSPTQPEPGLDLSRRAADEDAFRYGTVLCRDADQDAIERHLDTWGPWFSK